MNVPVRGGKSGMKGMLRMRSQVLWSLLCGALLACLCGRVSAQTVVSGIPGLIYDKPTGYLTWINSAGRASLGWDEGSSFGKWQFGSSTGDPLLTDDDNVRLIKIARAFIYFPDTNEEMEVGDGGRTVTWVDQDAIVGTHEATIAWSTADEENDFTVTMKIKLVRDVLKWSYTIKNNSSQAKRVAFRIVEDVQFPPNETLFLGTTTAPRPVNEAPYYVPGGGVIRQATEYLGGAVPSEWTVQYPAIPTVDNNFRPAWKGKQRLSGDCTKPDRLVFAELTDLDGYSWDVINDALLPENANEDPAITWGLALGQDTAVGLYYGSTMLTGNGNRVITGEVAMNWSEVSTINAYGLGVACPNWIGYRTGDDPSTGPVENGYFSPSILNVRAFVSCDTSQKSPNVAVSISLGTGLELEPGQVSSYNKTLTGIESWMVSKSDADQMSWRIRPNRQAAGVIPVTITATFINSSGDSSTAGSGVTTTVYVNVPALTEFTYPGGILPNTNEAMRYLTGFPFTFDNADARTALGLGNGVDLAWYDSTLKKYKYASSDAVTLTPGRAYWLRVPSTTKVVLQNATPISQRNVYTITLQRGWNAISNPYQFGIEWGMCRVEYEGTQYTLTQAVHMGLVRPEIWSWNANSGVYSPPSNPSPNNDLYAELKPYTGYWVYCTDTVSLVYTPNIFVPAMDANLPNARKRTVNGNSWRVNLVTTADGLKDPLATFGIDPAAATDSWMLNMMKPPQSPGGIASYFVRADGGRAAGNYAVDLRAPGTNVSWPLEVSCPRANAAVTISWPDLTQVPARTALILTDELTGQQIYMRTAANYTFNSGTGGARRFTITTDTSYARLQFTQAQVQAVKRGTGTTILYAISAPAAVTLRVRSVTGRLVRTLDAGRAAGGAATVQWDGRDADGKPVPAGMYLCELSAQAGNGQRARTTLTVPTR
jgi:hypothetical protein